MPTIEQFDGQGFWHLKPLCRVREGKAPLVPRHTDMVMVVGSEWSKLNPVERWMETSRMTLRCWTRPSARANTWKGSGSVEDGAC